MLKMGKRERGLRKIQGFRETGARSWARDLAAAGEEHDMKNHTDQRLKVLVFVAPNPTRRREGMEADDLLCSRNARPEKDGTGSLVVLRSQNAHDQNVLVRCAQ